MHKLKKNSDGFFDSEQMKIKCITEFIIFD